MPVAGAGSEVELTCEEHTNACTDYADTCIDCSATGSVDSDPDSCTEDETKCTCPDGCVVNGVTVGGNQDDVTDEAGCDAVQGTWIEEGDPKTGCKARSDAVAVLYWGDGTEAAALVCGMLGEGTGTDQCEGSDALARIKGYLPGCTDGDYACPTTEEIAALGCEWSSSTSTCVPNAALTTLLTEAWTESKAAGMLAGMLAAAPEPEPAATEADKDASGAGASVPSVIAAAIALLGGLFAL